MLDVEAEEGAKPEEAETLHNESSTHIFLPAIQRWGTALYVLFKSNSIGQLKCLYCESIMICNRLKGCTDTNNFLRIAILVLT